MSNPYKIYDDSVKPIPLLIMGITIDLYPVLSSIDSEGSYALYNYDKATKTYVKYSETKPKSQSVE